MVCLAQVGFFDHNPPPVKHTMPRHANVATKKASVKSTRKPVSKPMDPVAASVKSVLAQLQKCALQDSALEILLTSATVTLPLEQENRAPMHEQVMTWVAQHLHVQEQEAALGLAKANESLSSIDAERAQLAAAVAKAQEGRDSAEEKLKSATAVTVERLAALDAQREVDAAGVAARREKEVAVEAVLKVRESVEGIQAALSELMGGTVEEKQVKKQVQKVCTFLKKAEGFDSALLSTLPPILQKPASAMSQFEQSAATAAVDWLKARIAKLNEELGGAQAAVREAETGLTTLVGLEKSHAEATAAEEAASQAVSTAVDALEAAEKAVSDFDAATEERRSERTVAEGTLAEAKAAVSEFEKLRMRSQKVEDVEMGSAETMQI
mmetsp:Transcript_81827/g.218827  ORF Transcript_81827/g.218827 Transcript_81827/m.218827 type:complete len:382 (+) Transcript_81827:32-1177(+)